LIFTAAVLVALGICGTAVAGPIGGTTPTGEYYEYAKFDSGSGQVFKGGGDVDCYGNRIYVNRDGNYLDVYDVTLHDTDGDGAYEPDQHPDNPSATGPKEARTLSYVTSYYVPALDTPTIGEIYAVADGVYFLSQGNAGISKYTFATGVTSTVISSSFNLSQLGYDDVNNVWYASNESNRYVYSWNGSSWQFEFEYPNLAGGHMDGLEVVTDPKTNIPYVYVSDMTSDYLGQYRKTSSGWVQENLFEYTGTAGNVEGMGFGALGHFWATTGFSNSGSLYEIGGGDLGGYIPPAIPLPSAVWMGLGLLGLLGAARRARRRRI
jgi:hypothetical protein